MTPATDELIELWDNHTLQEFGAKDADAAVATLTEDAHVMHLPSMSGGVGRELLRRYYRDVFIPDIPDDTTIEPVGREATGSVLIDEMVITMTHDREIRFMIPGIPATGRRIVISAIVVVRFREGLMASEHLYWDQASVLAQLGLLDQSDVKVFVDEPVNFLREIAATTSFGRSSG
jgi:carboxymethylenebutenolidase